MIGQFLWKRQGLSPKWRLQRGLDTARRLKVECFLAAILQYRILRSGRGRVCCCLPIRDQNHHRRDAARSCFLTTHLEAKSDRSGSSVGAPGQRPSREVVVLDDVV